MSENKITTNRIEEVLLKKAQEKFRKELTEAINNLESVLGKYHVDEKGFEEFKKWLTQTAIVPTYHYHSHQVISSNLNPSHYPAVLNEELLKMAVDEFLKSVEETKATLESLEY
jgi:hypothetical protein